MDSNVILVENLNVNETEETIRPIFEKIGEITSLYMLMSRNNTGIGVAHITYKDSDDAYHAFSKLNNSCINGRTIHIVISLDGIYEREKKREQEMQNIRKQLEYMCERMEMLEYKNQYHSACFYCPSSHYQSIDLIPIGQMWNITSITRNTLSYKGKTYIVEASNVKNNSNSYSPCFLFGAKNGEGNAWETDSQQEFASISIHFDQPTLANVLKMTSKKGLLSPKTPKSFAITGINSDTDFKDLKTYHNVEWRQNETISFPFVNNTTEFYCYKIVFFSSPNQNKFELAELNLGIIH